MSRFLTVFTTLFLFSFAAQAQQFTICMDVVASSGGHGIQSNKYIAWTVGEPFVHTLTDASFTFTQGFHQPDPCGVSLVGTNDLSDWGLNLFPNPTDGQLILRYSTEKQGRLLAAVYDLFGRPMFENQAFSSPEGNIIDASAWPPGVYFLQLKDPGSQATTILRFVRL